METIERNGSPIPNNRRNAWVILFSFVLLIAIWVVAIDHRQDLRAHEQARDLGNADVDEATATQGEMTTTPADTTGQP